jgi:hypothetical protein
METPLEIQASIDLITSNDDPPTATLKKSTKLGSINLDMKCMYVKLF